jgi:exodeoxyribonuclease VII small subunit
MSDQTDISNLSYEAAYAELETIIARLETGDLPLDESVTLYARGRQLSAHCQALLDAAELRIQQVDDDGSLSPLA